MQEKLSFIVFWLKMFMMNFYKLDEEFLLLVVIWWDPQNHINHSNALLRKIAQGMD